MSWRSICMASAICAASSYGVYWEQISLDPVAEAQEERLSAERMAQSVAHDAMQRQYACLADNPRAWCDRDQTYADHLRTARALSREVAGVYNVTGQGRMLGVYALIALVSGGMVLSHLRRRVP